MSKGYNWVTPTDNSCGFPGHGYHVFAQPGNGVGCTTSSSTTNFTNFVYQATITVQHGDGKTIEAIIFRYDGVHQSFYYFGFDGFGNYIVGIKQNNIYLSPPLKQGHSSDFQEGLGVSNLLAVVVRENKIDFYVNSVFIDFAQDPNNTISSGQIGVYAAGGSSGDPSSVSSEIVFSDAQVWKL